MLSTRISILSALRAAAMLVVLAVVSACAGGGGTRSGSNGIDVDVSQPVQVALLLPYGSGDAGREQIARSLENAARLAQSDLHNASIDLKVYSDAGSSDGGASAASQAIADGAKIIVGPLFGTATAGAQGAAASAGLSVLSFSNNPDVAGGNVYILGTTFANTADRLVAYGLGHGMRNFGVVYPSGLEGETARDAVVQAINGRGATLTTTQPYNLSVEGIQASAGAIASTLNAGGTNAVVLTDGPTGGLAYIAEALRGNGISADQAQFMGIQRWDVSAEALAVPSLQGGVFAAPDPALVGAFNGRYRAAYGESPHELAGLAYDGIAAVGAMIAQARTQGGSPFSSARLTQQSGFAGVYGPFRFLSNGRVQRNLAIIEVQNSRPVVAESAARSFDAIGF